jgi:hypothetical protein
MIIKKKLAIKMKAELGCLTLRWRRDRIVRAYMPSRAQDPQCGGRIPVL